MDNTVGRGLDDGVRDDNVKEFAHGTERKEVVPTTWLLRQRQAGSDFNSKQILAVGLFIDAIAVSDDGSLRPLFLDDVVHAVEF